ncbi:MAG: protein kinase domain-containing protein, partial [Acidimicrobiales bacterium]
GPVDVAWLRSVAVDVLGALAAAHACGIVHRDIKPANILLDADGRAKVGDFGIAKAIRDGDQGTDPAYQDLTAVGMLVGTVAYLAPEQIQGATASPQSDLYALGVVLYEALAGRKPFVGEDPVAQARSVVDGNPPDVAALRPDVPADFAAVVRRAMSRHPGGRYASAASMRSALLGDDRAAAAPLVGAATQLVPAAGGAAVLPAAGLYAAGVGGAGAAAPTQTSTPTQAQAPAPLRAPAIAGGPPPGLGPPRPAPGPPGTGRRSIVAVLALLVLAGILAAVLLATRRPRPAGPGPTTTSSTSTTVPPTTTTVPAAVADLLQEARLLDGVGGAGPTALASVLRVVAATPASSRGAAADTAIGQTGALLSTGAITLGEYTAAVTVLQLAGGKAPAVPPTTSTSVSATTVPATTAPPTSASGASGTTGASDGSGPSGGGGSGETGASGDPGAGGGGQGQHAGRGVGHHKTESPSVTARLSTGQPAGPGKSGTARHA